MYVDKDRRFVYIRIPGTGSTTFLKALGIPPGVGSDHETLHHAMTVNQKWSGVDALTKLTVIRNPFDWTRTMHMMCRRSNAHWLEFVGTDEPESDEGKRRAFLLGVRTQLSWVTDPKTGEMLADRVLRIEDLADICREFNVPVCAERANQTGEPDKKKYGAEWSAEEVAIIRERMSQELAYYP